MFREPNVRPASQSPPPPRRIWLALDQFGGRAAAAVSSPVAHLLPGVVFMKWSRRYTTLALAFALVAGLSCTSDTNAPLAPSTEQQGSPSFGLIGDVTGGLTSTVTGTVVDVSNLLLCSPQPYDITKQIVGPEGGIIRVGNHSLVIPQGALSSDVEIKAEQIKGNTNSIRFSPEGLRFAKPSVLTIDYSNCSVVLLQKKIVYTDEYLKIKEVLKASLDLFKKKTVTAPIDHFSRYAVAW